MRPWIIVPTYTANATVFYQLRLCIESILREVPRSAYSKLIIVDDHSPYRGQYEAFQKHYAKDDRVQLLPLGDPLPSYYGPGGRGSEQGRPVSDGHGVALHRGIQLVQKQGATRIWTLDADTLILNGSCLTKASEVMDCNADVVRSVGDYEYGLPGKRDGLCFQNHRIVNGEKKDKFHEREGRTNAICGLWSLKDYDFPYRHPKGEGTEVDAARFENLGQSATRVLAGVWSRGLATAYFPFFRGRYVVHFGYGTLLFTREQEKSRGVGNAPDTKHKYAGRQSESYYAGYLQLKCPTPQFHQHLHKLFANRPPDDTSARFDTNLLVAPK